MDIVQEAFQTAASKIPDLELQNQSGLANWFASIALNKLREVQTFNRAEKRDRSREVSMDRSEGSWSDVEAVSSKEPCPPESAWKAELQVILDDCLMQLSPVHRDVILARDYRNLPWEEVALEVCRPNNIHATQELHRRAWIKLRRLAMPRLRDTRG